MGKEDNDLEEKLNEFGILIITMAVEWWSSDLMERVPSFWGKKKREGERSGIKLKWKDLGGNQHVESLGTLVWTRKEFKN